MSVMLSIARCTSLYLVIFRAILTSCVEASTRLTSGAKMLLLADGSRIIHGIYWAAGSCRVTLEVPVEAWVRVFYCLQPSRSGQLN